MISFRLDHRRAFDQPMNALRCRCYPRGYPNGVAKDVYDERSTHVVAYAEEALAGYLRLTPGPDGWFETQLARRAVIPTGREVLDLNRAAVAPEHRGHGLFELLLLEGLLIASAGQFRSVLGASKPERQFRTLLHDLGFRDICGPVDMYLPNGFTYSGIVVEVVPSPPNPNRWQARKLLCLDRLRREGYNVVGSGAAAGNRQSQAEPLAAADNAAAPAREGNRVPGRPATAQRRCC